MSETPRKVWQVEPDVHADDLETKLNTLAEDNYQIHSVHAHGGDYGARLFTVIAFDPTLIMSKQGDALAKSLAELMGKVQPP